MDVRAVLIQQVYPGLGYLPLLKECFERHARYCEKFGIDYQTYLQQMRPEENGAWDKVILVQKALQDGYDLVVWLDADAMIWDLDTDLRSVPNPPDTIGAVVFEKCRFYEAHYNAGVLYFRNGPSVRLFVAAWLAGYPGEHKWHEQKVFNDMSSNIVCALPATWNYTAFRHSGVGKPVIRGYHSIRGAEEKLQAMLKDLMP